MTDFYESDLKKIIFDWRPVNLSIHYTNENLIVHAEWVNC